jgi:hypothetical protein
MIDITRFNPARILPAIKRRMDERPFLKLWNNSELGHKNKEVLLQNKDKYKGKRLFLICNGPSIANMDLSVLKDEYTMCLNRFYIYFDKIGFVPNFLVCVEGLVLEQFADDINNLPLEKFVNFRYHESLDKCNYLKEAYSFNPFFQDDMTKPAHFGGTVTFASLQLAYWMGFQEVVIIGMDHSFAEKGMASTVEVRNYEKDESHFDANYFPKGIRWKLPDLEKSEYGYDLANKFYKAHGRKITDATVGGKCTIFDKGNFKEIISNKSI